MIPSLEFANLHDERHRLDNYWDTLRQVDVRTPKTEIISYDDKVPVSQIQEFMNRHQYSQVFVRSGYKAAVDRLSEGSIIRNTSDKEIKRTVNSLISQHTAHGIPHGNILVVRELIDLDYCTVPTHNHSEEVRYFIEDGMVIAKSPKDIDPIPKCSRRYNFVEDNVQDCCSPDDKAELVAEAFKDTDHSWSMDFVLDNRGVWWATEMHVNGVYYNEDREEWMNVCGHGEAESSSPYWMHREALNLVSRFEQ